MKVQNKYSGKIEDLSVSDLLEIGASSYREGQLESIEDHLNYLTEVIGRMLEHGKPTDNEILEITGNDYQFERIE